MEYALRKVQGYGEKVQRYGEGSRDMGKKAQRYGEGSRDMGKKAQRYGADGLRTKVKFFA
jgi:hypothetical protein